MNRTKIEWTDYTWNPITGCTKDCYYCYARAISKRFKRSFFPTFHQDRIFEPHKIKKPSMIFTCSMADFFDKNVERSWQERVFMEMRAAPRHTFQILTKVPENIPEDMVFPENLWLGVSVDRASAISRAFVLDALEQEITVRFVSFEPLLQEMDVGMACCVDWVIIGGMSGRKPFYPPKEWIDYIIAEVDCPVFVKKNAGYYDDVEQFPTIKRGGYEFPSSAEGGKK